MKWFVLLIAFPHSVPLCGIQIRTLLPPFTLFTSSLLSSSLLFFVRSTPGSLTSSSSERCFWLLPARPSSSACFSSFLYDTNRCLGAHTVEVAHQSITDGQESLWGFLEWDKQGLPESIKAVAPSYWMSFWIHFKLTKLFWQGVKNWYSNCERISQDEMVTFPMQRSKWARLWTQTLIRPHPLWCSHWVFSKKLLDNWIEWLTCHVLPRGRRKSN